MKFFRPNISKDEEVGSSWKYFFWGFVMLVIIGSFFLQMSMGLCPVP
jgi:hypothetical protein